MAKKTEQAKDIEKGLKQIFESMSKKMSEEDREHPFFKFLLENQKLANDPDEFNTMIKYPIERTIHTFVKEKFQTDNHLIANVYSHYDFFERNISFLCSQMFGGACSVDRARFIVKSAIRWKESGKIPKLNWEQEYTFHYPPKGTMEEWMNFVEGLDSLIYGNNKQYLLSIQALMKSCSTKSEGGETSASPTSNEGI